MRLLDWLILLPFCGLLLTQTVLSQRATSATYDETAHLPAGYVYLQYGNYSLNAEHPPLIKMLAALPLPFIAVKMPPEDVLFGGPWFAGSSADFTFGHRLLYVENDADRLLFWGRLAVLPLTLLLAGIVFLWTKHLFGRTAAFLAVFLYTFEPNLLAHAPLVNTDLGVACFIFLTMYGCYRAAQQLSIPSLLFAGFAGGLALATKFSALMLLPMLLLVGGSVVVSAHPIALRFKGGRLVHVTSQPRKLLILLAAMLGTGAVAYVTVWATYRFRFAGIPLGELSYAAPWEQILVDRPWIKEAFLWMKDVRALPEAYLYGFATVLESVKRPTFLLGEISTEGRWYYFLVTFVLKTPLPLLLLLLMTPLALRSLWRKDPVAMLCLVVPIVVYLGIASASRLNIGHRHLLPIYPFLFVMAGSLVPWLRRQRVLVMGSVGVLAVWYVVSSVSIFPHYLAYFNELAGGPDRGYKYLVDSNLHWGQDLKGLKRFMDTQGIERVWLAYFGSASPEYYGITYDYLPGNVTWTPQNIRDDVFRFDVLPPLRGVIAISATNLQGVYYPPGKTDYLAWYRQQTPIAKIGYSIFIYRVE